MFKAYIAYTIAYITVVALLLLRRISCGTTAF